MYALPLVIPLQRSLRHAQLVAEARIDAKTGLLNDRTWRRQAEGEVARAVRTRAPVAVGILDIDHFKRVNDTYGHPAGDAVLAAVAAAMRATLRGYDVIGRTGGEEFAFILPGDPCGRGGRGRRAAPPGRRAAATAARPGAAASPCPSASPSRPGLTGNCSGTTVSPTQRCTRPSSTAATRCG